MKDLTLAKMQALGIDKWMSDKEIEKTLTKALEEQQQLLDTQQQNTKPKEITLDGVLKDGGLFTYSFNGKKYKLNVLTKEDMNILDNSSNYVEDGVEYDIVRPYRYHCKNSHDNYITVKANSYDEAQNVIDSIYSKGLYKVSASAL